MKHLAPDWQSSFRCTADKCSDNCCIGWEIDIDPVSLARYRKAEGEFGETLRRGILSNPDGACFALTKDERCVFLNQQNLCDIYLHLGENALCDICTRHPRFFEWYGDIREGGLGMCCEEAARLWLSFSGPLRLVEKEGPEPDDGERPFWYSPLFSLRQKLFALLEDGSRPLMQRLTLFLQMCQQAQEYLDNEEPEQLKHLSVPAPVTIEKAMLPTSLLSCYQELEVMDPSWPGRLEKALCHLPQNWGRRLEFLQNGGERWLSRMAEYLVYRYLLKACFDEDIAGRGRWIVSYCLVALAVALEETPSGSRFSGEAEVELAKALSKEVEYSEENLEFLADAAWEREEFLPETLCYFLKI